MRTLKTTIVLFCGVGAVADVSLSPNNTDGFVDAGVDNLVQRALKFYAGPSDRANLDEATVGKLKTGDLPLDGARIRWAKERGLFKWNRYQKIEGSFVPGTAFFFDLDDCLFPFVGTGMDKYEIKVASDFLMKHMAFTQEQVNAFRRMFREKGLTIWSALLKAGVDVKMIETFKDMLMSDIPYETVVKPDDAYAKTLRQDLLALPKAPRYILTNNFRCHAARVLKCLKIDDLFEAIIGIDDLNPPAHDTLIHKPMYEFYKIAMMSVGAKHGLMVDDRNKNCVGAVKADMFAVQMTKFMEKGSAKPMSRAESMEHILDPHSTVPVVDSVKDLNTFAQTIEKIYGGKAKPPFPDPSLPLGKAL
jgi:pyrimidine 5'-nucleotidase